MKATKFLISGLLLIGLTILLSACTQPEPTPCADCPVITPCPTSIPRPDLSSCPQPVISIVPYEQDWVGSGHGDATAEAFRHWDGDDPQEVPLACAKCHSDTGFMDFLGSDGSESGKVDSVQPVSNGISCVACHNDAASTYSHVTFPSGVVIADLGSEAKCMECHQGRASKLHIDGLLASFNITQDLDIIPTPIKEGDSERKLGFVNIHYFAAAATLYGGQVKSGYEYPGKTYNIKNEHVKGYDTCIGCHDPHSLEVKINQCAVCHQGVAKEKDLRNLRMVSSNQDYDGDNNISEGIAEEISGLQDILYTAIQAYASEVIGTGIVYSAIDYPYYLADADGDGVGDKTASGAFSAYPSWTGRLLKAAYNYHLSVKDPGAYAHGSNYIIQLLYDSIEDLNTKLVTPIDMAGMSRDNAGHFAGSLETFRHWDDRNYQVTFSCALCHSASGLPAFIDYRAVRNMDTKGDIVTIGMVNQPASNGLACTSCHNPQAWPARYTIASVVFPSGKTISLEGMDTDGLYIADDSNLCLYCHQGNESTAGVDSYLSGIEVDTVDVSLAFKSIHYSAAGATLLGNEVAGAYQYIGKEYDGYSNHPDNKCIECHDAHTLKIDTKRCYACHVGTTDYTTIRMYSVDFDGDGDVTEGIKGEIDTLSSLLYAEIQKYSQATASVTILYNGYANPYFFSDTDQDGVIDTDRKGAYVPYNAFTPRLLRAAYNYHFSQKDPAGYVHNPNYVIQILIDSIEDLGGDVTSYTRP